jgi:hypothetical protein
VTPFVAFLFGILAAGYVVVAMFFVQFWRTTRDRLFVFFVVAFSLLALERVVAVLDLQMFEGTPWLYLLRLAAFGCIVVGIIDKNRKV